MSRFLGAFSVVLFGCSSSGLQEPEPSPIRANELVREAAIQLDQGEWAHFEFEVPEGTQTTTFWLSGGSGDADLYVRHGAAPSRYVWDCLSENAGNDDSCSFVSPEAGTLYVGVYAYTAVQNMTLSGDLPGSVVPPAEPVVWVDEIIAGAAEETLDFYAATQDGEMLEVTLTGGTGDAELFIDHIGGGYEDCASESEGNGENCSVYGRAEWDIQVVGFEAFEGVRIQAVVTVESE